MVVSRCGGQPATALPLRERNCLDGPAAEGKKHDRDGEESEEQALFHRRSAICSRSDAAATRPQEGDDSEHAHGADAVTHAESRRLGRTVTAPLVC